MVNECQQGFVTGKPCISNLIETLEYTRPILDSGEPVDLLYLDVCQAFGKVDDALLIFKLRHLGFGRLQLERFMNCLTDHRQSVTVFGATWDTLTVTSGVPHGSLLGLVLILLYINCLPNVVSSSYIPMFEDDTKIFKTINSADCVTVLQTDLSILVK